ncbi:MAG TPA: hypothetical protein VF418_09360 [Sphingomonadaceae bacterium]
MAMWRNTLWRDVSPTGAIKDFVEVWKGNRYRWRTLALALAMTGALLYIALPATVRAPPPHPDITYISTLDENRTRAQIMASNIAHQKAEEKVVAAEQRQAEDRKKFWEAIGRATFIDVDAIKKKAAEDAAAQKKADEQRAAENMARWKEQAGSAGK